jgi:acetyl coenzyme A synthetase (ADP forming)-like protein
VRTITGRPPAADELEVERLVLRDGSTATIRAASIADHAALRRFFDGLSPESRRNRFLAAGQPPDSLIHEFCAPNDPVRARTVLAWRLVDGESRIVGVASYAAVTDTAAEVAVAVDDRFHGKGIGTLLVERLGAVAAANGLQRFHATMFADNTAMRDVFRDSGFQIRSKTESGCVDVQLSLTPTPEGVAAAEERHRSATIASLAPMLEPRAVAVIGASREAGKIGARVLRALIRARFNGPIYAVNRSGEAVDGVPTFKSARDLPAGVDLAVIAVPQPFVAGIVDDCAVAGVKSVVVITAGYAETGADGRALQNALLEQIRGHGMRMLGPNGMGLLNLNPEVRLNASFAPKAPPPGRVAFSSQSGALGLAILDLAAARHVGLSAFVSVGNKADVSSNDLLEYWGDDPNTHVILLYLESFGNPRRFARVARRVGLSKPIVALKSGRSRAGARAAGSHTAALASRDEAADALFRQSGVIRVATVDEMFDVAACLDAQPLPAGTRIGIVTNAGGPGILAADACEAAGLSVVRFSNGTCEQLGAFLPRTASVGNPVDMIASAGPDDYRRALDSVLRAPEVDAVLAIYTPVDERGPLIVDGIREGIALARTAGETRKPIVACLMSDALRAGRFRVGRETIPTYAFPENAVRALGKTAAYAAWKAQPAGLRWGFDDVHVEAARAICRAALADRSDVWLDSHDSIALLQAFGIPVAAGALAHTADEAAAFAAVLGFPVAAKIASAELRHKTDIGGVRLNLTNAIEVKAAFEDVLTRGRAAAAGARIDGVLIQPMVKEGVETIIGIAHDPVFGSLIGFGLGGVDVELLSDVHFRIAPLTDQDADELLHEIRAFPLLQGYRGRTPVDLPALREILLRVSALAEELPEIIELDLNPVIALAPGKGCRIVDARIRVARRKN